MTNNLALFYPNGLVWVFCTGSTQIVLKPPEIPKPENIPEYQILEKTMKISKNLKFYRKTPKLYPKTQSQNFLKNP